jgi:hypothetical protein
MIMATNNTKNGWKIAYNFFVFDTFINWILGILFIFFFRYVEAFLSYRQMLPDYIWISMGTGLLLFGFWQTYVLYKGRFSPGSRLFSCVMAWLCFAALTYALLFMQFPIKVFPLILVWTGNVYMLILGVLYLASWYKSKKEENEKK